ncbi:reverse transcriptase zinc-binding domain-containing protein, partial [Tanacetum coccineum]
YISGNSAEKRDNQTGRWTGGIGMHREPTRTTEEFGGAFISRLGPLFKIVSNRNLYSARFSRGMVVADMVPILNAEKNDRIVWKNNDGRECNCSLKEVYNDMREMSIEVKWAKMIWFSCIPKHSFILWLAIQEKLMTYDRMIKWGYCDMTCCLLCKNNVETHDHLFFNCPFSAAIWKELKLKTRFKSNAMLWNNIVKELAEKQNGNNIWSIVRRLCLATVVCSIWREKNNRML